MEIEHEEHKMIHDLKLRLSPPGINPKDESASANQLENSQSESNESSESDENLVGLVLMGCTKCHIYVMVCEVEPKCPNCKNSFLIDMFQHNTLPNTKRSKGC
uniref:GIR1-like zinc ribbon domain-containing protein n=1 Tax=Manihot esculenta TaxID=3983 RepID=A0A2C9VM40_MANES